MPQESEKNKISLLMPVYLGGKDSEMFVASINSVLSQTWRLWELIIIDDGSPKRIADVLSAAGIDDARIKVIRRVERGGITVALIDGMSIATGDYIARLDADDVALPDRFQKQALRLQSDPELVLVGTWFSVKNEDRTQKEYYPPDSDKQLRSQLIYKNPFCHSSVMFRRSCYDRAGGYDKTYYTTQDLALWFQLADLGKFGIVERVLTIRNVHGGSVSVGGKAKLQVYNGVRVRFAKGNKQRTGHRRPVIWVAAIVSAIYQHLRSASTIRTLSKIN